MMATLLWKPRTLNYYTPMGMFKPSSVASQQRDSLKKFERFPKYLSKSPNGGSSGRSPGLKFPLYQPGTPDYFHRSLV